MNGRSGTARWMGAALMAVTGAAVATEPAVEPKLVRAEVALQVDAEGRVVAVDSGDSLPAVLRGPAERVIRRWRFAPVIQDGRAVSGTTYATVHACVVPEGDRLAIGVDMVGNGPGVIARKGAMPAPFPPTSLMTRGSGVQFDIQLRYRVLASGRGELEHARFADPALQARHGKAMEASARRWLAERRFKPEVLDGVPTSTTIEQPVSFETRRFDSARAAEKSGRESALAAARTSDACRIAGGVPESRAVAVDSPFARLPEG